MSEWRASLKTPSGRRAPGDEPWYRQPDAWVVVGMLLLPFGWVLALGRVAWVYATARRSARAQRP